MAGGPADQGGKGKGCYIVYEDKQISYLDFEGVAVYTFVVDEDDADMIQVTEPEPNEVGELILGNTAA